MAKSKHPTASLSPSFCAFANTLISVGRAFVAKLRSFVCDVSERSLIAFLKTASYSGHKITDITNFIYR